MKKNKKDDDPFLNKEETIKNLLRIIFLNGDIINPTLLSEAIGIPLDLSIEVMSTTMASFLFSTPEEIRKELIEQIKEIKNR